MADPQPDLGDLVKDLLWDSLVKAAIGKLVAALPSWAAGPVGYLVGIVVTYVADKLYEVLKEAVILESIGFRNQAHRRAFDKAAVTLKIIGREKGPESREYLDAKEDAKSALSKFVQFRRAS